MRGERYGTARASRIAHGLAGALTVLAGAAAGAVHARDQSREDAWWTGPMLAPSAATLPSGHMLIEPYLFDVMSDGRFDANGTRQSAPGQHDIGSLTYMLYGVTDRVTVGMIPRFVFNEPAGAANSSHPGVGDLTLQAGFGVTRFEDGHRTPAIAVVLDETLPTGRYQRLSRASDGFGGGAYTTALSVYSQDYLWMPNGRILRVRLDLTYSLSSSVGLHDASVYGTPVGFSGRAYPGNSFTADAAAEYSVTRNWVLALDVVYEHQGETLVRGEVAPPAGGSGGGRFSADSASLYALQLAPAIEYNFSSRIGVLLGVRLFAAGRNTTSSVTPALALNMVY